LKKDAWWDETKDTWWEEVELVMDTFIPPGSGIIQMPEDFYKTSIPIKNKPIEKKPKVNITPINKTRKFDKNFF